MTTSIPNMIIIISLIIILLLVYIRTKKFELYEDSITNSKLPNTQLSLIPNDTLQNSYLLTFINKYINRQNNQNKYKTELNTRQNIINDLSLSVSSLINPSRL